MWPRVTAILMIFGGLWSTIFMHRFQHPKGVVLGAFIALSAAIHLITIDITSERSE